MNAKQYIGRRVSRYEGCGATRAVDGVSLIVDEEHEYRAGDMDGYVMEITCPYGTQAMADALLAQLKGRTYTAYEAENAVMDPEAELGDGVTVNGVYTLLASRQMVLGSGHLCRIGVPADSEIDHEYGVADTYNRRIERKLAQSRSYIDKKSDEIKLGIEDEMNGRLGEVKLRIDGIEAAFRDDINGLSASFSAGLDGLRSELTDDMNGLSAEFKAGLDGVESRLASDVDGRFSEFRQDLDGLSARVGDAEGDLITLSATAKKLAADLEDAQGNISSLQRTATSVTDSIKDIDGDINTLTRTATSLESSIQSANGEISTLKQTAAGLTSTVGTLTGTGPGSIGSMIEQRVDKIKLTVAGELGGKASITLSGAGGGSGTIDLSKVREAVANDDTNIDITSGSIHFYNKTFAVDSENLTVTETGSVSSTNMTATNISLRGNSASYDPDDPDKPYSVAATLFGNMYLSTENATASYGIYGSPGSRTAGNIELLYASTNYNQMPSVVLGYVPQGKSVGARINGTVISTQSPIVPSSDRDVKKDIVDLPERYMKMLDYMRPVTYRYTWQQDNEPTHWGYIAQEMEEAVTRAGMTRDDVASLVGRDGTGQMGIGYTELIPLLHMKIRQLEQRLERLEADA